MAFTWDKEKRVYRYGNGHTVPDAALYGWIDAFSLGLAKTYRSRAERLQAAMRNVESDADEVRAAYEDWNFQTVDDISSSYLAAGVAAFGGFDNATDNQIGFAENEARRQQQYFQNLIGETASGGDVTMLAARSEMYGLGVFALFANAVGFREGNFANEERRILGATDHCVDCLEQAALKWVAYGSLRKIGDSVCRTRCRCRFEYRFNDGNLTI